jgi:hypothetical protein
VITPSIRVVEPEVVPLHKQRRCIERVQYCAGYTDTGAGGALQGVLRFVEIGQILSADNSEAVRKFPKSFERVEVA